MTPETISPQAFLFSIVHLDRNSDQPLYWQIYQSMQQAILNQQLPPGLRLPSTRDLAEALSVSRNTVVNAIDQLVAEGYLETRPKSGTYVSHSLPEEMLRLGAAPMPIAERAERDGGGKRPLSQRGQMLQSVNVSVPRRTFAHHTFAHGMPAFDHFPFKLWARLVNKQYRHGANVLFDDNTYSGAGFTPLREAIAYYLRGARAVRCQPEQVIIVNGSQHGLYLAAQVLLDEGDTVWLEEPSYLGARAALVSGGAKIAPVPVGNEGLVVEAGIAQAPNARCAYVTPSHQFPLGHTMSVATRIALLNWAEAAGAWIIEDDYDSEYRYSGQPLPSLQGLDRNNRVIYVGTFSKVLFPSIRLGYLVVPPDLARVFAKARMLMDMQSPNVTQAALAEFMQAGHFVRHIRRMRTLYAARRAYFVSQAEAILGDKLRIIHADSGMHVVGWLASDLNDVAVMQAANKHDVEVMSLSQLYLDYCPRPGLVLGFCCVPKEQVRPGLERLRQAIVESGG
ncbi:MAG: PLP-dependent aminotransferase family protein [Chloroflexota bacterium]